MDNKKKMKVNIIVLVIALVIALTLVSVGTYAAWIWRSTVNKDVVFNTSKNVQEYIIYDEGESKFIGNFQPTSTFCEGQYLTVSFYKTQEAADIFLNATIYMDVNSIGDNIATSSNVYWIITKGDSSITCTNGLNSSLIVNSGTFNGVSSGETITLTSEIPVTTSNQTYTVWIWIDESGSNSSLSGETIDVNVWTQIDMLPSEPGATFTDGTFLTWDELKLASNGTKYGYDASQITDTYIGEAAFYECKTLLSIVIPKSVKNIGTVSFYYCTSLKNVIFLGDVLYIDDGSFHGTSLGSITLPESLRNWGDCNYGATPMTSINFNGTMAQFYSLIGDWWDGWGCGNITEAICSDGIISIPGARFTDGTFLTWNQLKLAENGTKYGYYASLITDTYIGDTTFMGCKTIASITFPEGIKEINDDTVVGASSLNTIILPPGLTSINYYGLSDSGVQTLIIPSSLTSIASYGLAGSSNLTKIIFTGTKAQWNAITKGSNWNSGVPATEVICSDGTVSIS